MLGLTPVKTVGSMKKPLPAEGPEVKASPPERRVAPSSLPALTKPRTRSYCVLVTWGPWKVVSANGSPTTETFLTCSLKAAMKVS